MDRQITPTLFFFNNATGFKKATAGVFIQKGGLMIGFDYKYRQFLLIFLACAVLLMIHMLGFAAKKGKDKKKNYVMTEIELQSELMSYADRFASRLIQAF